MADEPEIPDTEEELLLDTPLEEGDKPADPGPGDEAEEVLTFGDESEPQEGDSNLIKHLRQQIKERDKRLSEAERSAPRVEPVVVGEKPTLESCDWDADKFESELDAWKDRKAKAERQKETQQEAGEAEREQWQAELNRYNESKSKLSFADISDAEENVKASLDTAQQAVLLMAADDPAKLTYALGKHPDRLAALAAEKNPLKLAAKIAKLEGQLKMTQRRKPPEPDTPERGSARLSPQTQDRRLKKLEDEAEKTGDRTELNRYKRQLQEAPRRPVK